VEFIKELRYEPGIAAKRSTENQDLK